MAPKTPLRPAFPKRSCTKPVTRVAKECAPIKALAIWSMGASLWRQFSTIHDSLVSCRKDIAPSSKWIARRTVARSATRHRNKHASGVGHPHHAYLPWALFLNVQLSSKRKGLRALVLLRRSAKRLCARVDCKGAQLATC